LGEKTRTKVLGLGIERVEIRALHGAQRLGLLPGAQEHILQQQDGKRRFMEVVRGLSQAFALCAASDEATAIRDDVAFFQTVRAALSKGSGGSSKSPEEIDAAVRQLVSKAIVASDQIIDVFTAAGLKRPDISILDDRFLAEVRGLKHKNVAAELLARLLKDEIQARSKKNVVQGRLFSEQLRNYWRQAPRSPPIHGRTALRRAYRR
jgi:type I restriction enzyme R subunit